jgi:hypothetical protein
MLYQFRIQFFRHHTFLCLIRVDQIALMDVAIAHVANQKIQTTSGVGLVHAVQQRVGQARNRHASIGADGAPSGARLHTCKVGFVTRRRQARALIGC